MTDDTLTTLNPGDTLPARTSGLDFSYLSNPGEFRKRLAGQSLIVHGQLVPADVDLTPRLLSTQEIRRVGALTVQEETNVNTDQFLSEQRGVYERASRAHLEEELLRRDKTALLEGRQLQDGRLSGNLLRELVRHLLQKADHAALSRFSSAAGNKTVAIDEILTALGATPADRRLLKESGTTLGGGRTEEEMRLDFDKLADGTLPHTSDNTTGRPDVADSIKDRLDRQVAKKVEP